MPTAMDLSRRRVDELEAMHLFYCNELPWRCSNPRCKDCSTAVSDILNASGAGVNPCGTSFTLAGWAFHAERPDWFSDLYGHDLPGTFISYEDAKHVPGFSLRGSNWGMYVDSEGDGHVEWRLAEGPDGKRTWGAHSHASGVGFDDDGLDTHSLAFHAVPPHFLPFMTPPPPIAWDYLHELVTFRKSVSVRRQVDKKGKRITGALKYGDKGPDVVIMKKLLHGLGYPVPLAGDVYGWRCSRHIKAYKLRNGWPKKDIDGNTFGASIINSILK